MLNNPIAAVTHLLDQTGQAHGAYEATVLNGVYDQEWAAWYARWALDHGLNDLVGTAFSPEALSDLLSSINDEHQRSDRQLGWAAFTAQRLVQRYSGPAEG